MFLAWASCGFAALTGGVPRVALSLPGRRLRKRIRAGTLDRERRCELILQEVPVVTFSD
jgi:hypothetical protein